MMFSQTKKITNWSQIKFRNSNPLIQSLSESKNDWMPQKPSEYYNYGNPKISSRTIPIGNFSLEQKLIRLWKPESASFKVDKFLFDISKFVKIKNETEVRDFLISELFKIDSYLDIIQKIIVLKLKYFEDDQLTLCINHDPEINDEFLKFYIRQNCYSSDIMSKIYKLRADYAKDLTTKKIWVYITTDFKQPS
jgi:hypothetical protein